MEGNKNWWKNIYPWTRKPAPLTNNIEIYTRKKDEISMLLQWLTKEIQKPDLFLPSPENVCPSIKHLRRSLSISEFGVQRFIINKIVICYCIFFPIKVQPVGRSWDVVFEQYQVGLLSIAPTSSSSLWSLGW